MPDTRAHRGPHPKDHRCLVFHTFEVCDPVQAETYEIDGVPVSNFVLPGWFTRGDAAGTRNDFLGRPVPGELLPSFTMAPGGYLCYWDPRRENDHWHAVFDDGDAEAERRLAARTATPLGRGSRRRHGRG